MNTFGERLYAAMQDRGPFCAGIDPHSGLLHDWGLDDDLAGMERFALEATQALAPVVAAIKPQSAFFERFGSRGIAVLERVIAIGRESGAQVILDVKRGDIGSTSQAYADAYFDPASPLACDAITASPYLGFGSLMPMIDTATQFGGGVFVLALTSNKEAPEVQHAKAGELTVAGVMLDHLKTLNHGAQPMGSFGAVVGATIGDTTEDLAINGPMLVPGIGAQGGSADDVRRIFGASTRFVLPSSSREVLGAGPSPSALAGAAQRSAESFARLPS